MCLRRERKEGLGEEEWRVEKSCNLTFARSIG